MVNLSSAHTMYMNYDASIHTHTYSQALSFNVTHSKKRRRFEPRNRARLPEVDYLTTVFFCSLSLSSLILCVIFHVRFCRSFSPFWSHFSVRLHVMPLYYMPIFILRVLYSVRFFTHSVLCVLLCLSQTAL